MAARSARSCWRPRPAGSRVSSSCGRASCTPAPGRRRRADRARSRRAAQLAPRRRHRPGRRSRTTSSRSRRSTSSRPAAPSARYRDAGPLPGLAASSPRRSCSLATSRSRVRRTGCCPPWSSSGLTTRPASTHWIGRMRPLRRAKPFRRVLGEIAGGAHSMSELDVSRMCRHHRLPMPPAGAAPRLGRPPAASPTPNGVSRRSRRRPRGRRRLPHGRRALVRRHRARTWPGRHRRDRPAVHVDPAAGGSWRIARDLRRVGVGESSA